MEDGTTTTRRRGRQAANPTTPDPIEIAMEAEAVGVAPTGVAARVLEGQERLIAADLQHRRWQIASERAGFGLKLLTGLAGLAAMLLLAVMAWQASRADGVVIKPFSVPPALAARGITGEAVASQVLDHINVMAGIAQSSQRRRSAFTDRGEAVSIEIPATGVSLGQVQQWLRATLGRQTIITGELTEQADGSLALAVRAGDEPLPLQTGPAGDVRALSHRAAEEIYQRTQDIGLYLYLAQQNRWAEALARSRESVARNHGNSINRARAWNGIGAALQVLQGDAPAEPIYRTALAVDPRGAHQAAANLAGLEHSAGHVEAAVRHLRLAVANYHKDPLISPDAADELTANSASQLALWTGDFRAAYEDGRRFRLSPRRGVVRDALASHAIEAAALLALHERTRAQALQGLDVAQGIDRPPPPLISSAEDGDWPALLAQAERVTAGLDRLPDKGVRRQLSHAVRGLALAHLGRLDEAEATLSSTPLDCVPCLIARAWTATARGDAAAADRWYGEAARLAPSQPTARYEWGRALLARGQADGAIAQFRLAAAIQPKWADPVERWGEALLAKGDAKGAAEKFAKAAPLAPRWGRLHLKWGEALARLGKADEAKAQWKTADRLDLTPAERAELATVVRNQRP